MTDCPFCSASNRDDATVCAVCGADLPASDSAPARTVAPTADVAAPSRRSDGMMAFAFGAVLTAATGGAFLGLGAVWPSMYAIAFERGWTPFVLMALFGFSLGILLAKNRDIRLQNRVLGWRLLPEGEAIAPGTLARARADLLAECGDHGVAPSRSLLVGRLLHGLDAYDRERSIRAVADTLRNDADIDADAAVTGYTILRVFVWAMPIVGFIGTVIGIGEAIGSFSQVIQDVQDVSKLNEQLKPALSGVTGGLSVAFDTTLLALVLTVPVMLLMSQTQKKEEIGLVAMERYCLDEFLGRLPVSEDSDGGTDVVRGLRELWVEVERGLGDHVARLDAVIGGRVGEFERAIKAFGDQTGHLAAVAAAFDERARTFESAAKRIEDGFADLADDLVPAAENLEAGLSGARSEIGRLLEQLKMPRRLTIETVEFPERPAGQEDGSAG